MLKKVYKKSLAPFYKVLDSIAEELLQLWRYGVDIFLKGRKLTLYICVVAVKADWPLLAKLGRFQRFFGRKTRLLNAAAKGICHLCRAGQDNIPYHDYSQNAAWRPTYLQDEAYDGNPPFHDLPWHNPLIYRFDIFHVGHKGVFAELAGSAIVVLMDMGLAGDGAVPNQLSNIYSDMVLFCRENHLSLRMSNLARTLISWETDADYPCGSWFKGADTTVACKFLETRFGVLARVDPSDEYITSIHMALRSANEFMRGLYSHGLWLRRHEALRLVEHGFQFVANYVQAAYEALFHSRTRFKL
ncbi:unnamed protein product, partial [Symbiodinium pilosum]